MLGKVLALSTLLAFVFLSALLQSTSPSTIHPAGILIVFILLYVLALGVLTFCLFSIYHVLIAIGSKKGEATMTLQRAYYYASVIALAPVMLLGARSIGRTGVYDIVLIMLFECIACFYISKRR